MLATVMPGAKASLKITDILLLLRVKTPLLSLLVLQIIRVVCLRFLLRIKIASDEKGKGKINIILRPRMKLNEKETREGDQFRFQKSKNVQ